MEPIPETTRAIEDYGPFVIEDQDLLAELVDKADRVGVLVPDSVGLSITSNQDHATFTLVATAARIALLDAIQYLAGGPCVAAISAERVLAYDQESLFDERQWQLFARGTAAMAVASTLSLPIVGVDGVIGSVNLYAATPHAFDGHHEAIAAIFGAWAPGAITNADLTFSSRNRAESTPDELRDEIDLTVASNLIAAQENVSPEVGRQRLQQAALRAAVTEAQLAHTIVVLQRLTDID